MNRIETISLPEQKILTVTLIISIVVHSLFLLNVSSLRLFRAQKILKPVDIVYFKPKVEKKTEKPQDKKNVRELKSIKQEKLVDSKVLLKKDSGGSPLIKDMNKLGLGATKLAQKPAQMDRMPVERRISVPPIKSEKINNPIYLNYYQSVRMRIKEQAYRNYTDYTSGEVYLTFVLLSDGSLKQLKLIEEKTNANSSLRTVGLKSIKESNPFPPFPADLRYPELSFNVVISFEVKEK